MATAVQLVLSLDDQGAVSRFDRFRQFMKGALDSLVSNFRSVEQETKQLGDIAERNGQRATSAFRGIESATQRARLAERVLIQELGVELPGVLTKVAAKSQIVGPILAGAFSLSIFTSVIGALGGIGNKIIEVTDKMGGYTEAVKQMEQETIQASRQAFLKPETIDITFKHLQEVNQKIEEFQKKKNALEDERQRANEHNQFSGFGGGGEELAPVVEENALIQRRIELQKESDKLEDDHNKLVERQKELVGDIVRIAQEQAKLAGLTGFAKIAEEKRQAIAAIRKSTGADTAVGDQLVAAKDKEFAAQSIEIARQSAKETLSLRHQVTLETLSDEGKIREDEKFSIQELDQLRRQSLITRQDYEQRAVLIHQQATNKIKALDLEVVKIQQEADNFVLELKAQSLTGEEQIYAQRNLKIKQLEDQLGALRAGPLGEKELAQMKAISEKEIAIFESTDEQITQFRTEQAEKRSLVVEQAAEQQKDAETAAALAAVDPWRRAYAQITVESNKRIEQIDKEERNQLAKYKEGSEEYVAISQAADARREEVHAETNAKILEENRRMVDQLGSELQSVFEDIGSGNIGKRILKNMEKLFFDIVAQWILSLGVMKSQAGGILGSIVFGPGSTGANVFGGGSGAGGLGGLIGGLFGGGGLLGPGGTPPFVAPSGGSAPSSATTQGTSTSSLASLLPGNQQTSTGALFGSSLGNLFGTGTNTNAIAGSPAQSASSTSTALNGLFGQSSSLSSVIAPSGPLSTQSLSDIFSADAGHEAGHSAGVPVGGSKGGLLGLKNLLSPNGLLGLGALGSVLLGKLGGTPGAIGGTLLALGLTGKLAGLTSALFASIGGIGASAVLGGGIGGLIGFGLGQNFGKTIGALSGAGTGALTGFLVGGPIGAIVGGLIGLLGGIFGGIFGGGKRKKQANSLVDSTILPDIKKIVDSYENFQLDFAGANKQLDDLDTQAKAELSKLKGEGKSVFDKRVQPAIDDAKKEIKHFEDERQRRSSLVFGPPQFHDGGLFSSALSTFITRPGEGLAVLKEGEFVVEPQATSRNLATLEAINSGRTVGGDMHFHAPLINAQRIDESWLRNGGIYQIADAIRRARYEGVKI